MLSQPLQIVAVKSAVTLIFSVLDSAGLAAITGSARLAGTSAGLCPKLLLKAGRQGVMALARVGTPLPCSGLVPGYSQ